MVNQELIGYHKGALATLVKEREELIRLVKVTEQLMQLHLESLKKLGIDLSKEVKKTKKA